MVHRGKMHSVLSGYVIEPFHFVDKRTDLIAFLLKPFFVMNVFVVKSTIKTLLKS